MSFHILMAASRFVTVTNDDGHIWNFRFLIWSLTSPIVGAGAKRAAPSTAFCNFWGIPITSYLRRSSRFLDAAWRTVYRLGFPVARVWWRIRRARHQGAL